MILATRYVVRAYLSQSILSSPHSATCAWCVFNTFTTSSSGVYGVRIVNMIYGLSRWPGEKSGHSTGQDTSHFTPPMPSQVLCRQHSHHSPSFSSVSLFLLNIRSCSLPRYLAFLLICYWYVFPQWHKTLYNRPFSPSSSQWGAS